MSDFANIIYEKFFMRDLLGKILPGFIVTITLFSICGIQNFSDLVPFEIRSILWVIILPWSLLTGSTLQKLGELLGLHSSSPRPKRVLFFKPHNKVWVEVNKEFYERFYTIKNASDKEWTPNLREQRERYVYLKEGSGNLSLALLFLFLYLLISGECCIQILIPLFIFTFLLYWSHLLYATRQANFEIRAMKESGLLKKEDADKMVEHIRCKLLF